MEFKKASKSDLEAIWNKNISTHKNDSRWEKWKNEYVYYNENGMAVTFVVCDEIPIGEITILFSHECKPVKNKPQLCDGHKIANLNAFRIDKKYEGKGYISALLKMAEEYARELGFSELSIGVEATETRNLAIYLHWGFSKFVLSEIDHDENDALILYYKKSI